MKCSRCSEKLPAENDFVVCHGCKQQFDYVCAGVREVTWRKYSADAKLAWRCIICKTKNGGDNDGVNIRPDWGDSILPTPTKSKGCGKSKIHFDGDLNEPTKTTSDFNEVDYLRELLRHKAMIIDGQADLIRSLKDQITLLKEAALTSGAAAACSIDSTMHQKPTGERVLPQKTQVRSSSTTVAGGQFNMQQERVKQANGLADNTKSDTHEAIARAKLRNIINLTNDDDDVGGQEWKTVKYPRRRKTIIGERASSETCRLRAATTYSHWHVYRLHPDTTSDEVENYLKNEFPGVVVETLKSANPSVYSSFKVTVAEKDGDRILDAGLWPSGTRINRFFLPKKN